VCVCVCMYKRSCVESETTLLNCQPDSTLSCLSSALPAMEFSDCCCCSVVYNCSINVFAAGFLAATAELFFKLKLNIFYILRKYGVYRRQRQPGNVGNYSCLRHCTMGTYTLCLQKNDNDVPRYNFNAHQRILIIFGRDIAE